MLAGRKLLLADDSATIQKVIDLTFADEGVRVVIVNNGQDAIDQLLEVQPDIVLADVFMPARNGYEVCEYVKTNEKLKHIPVMLLVGSFEPFDEAEARRVGADDILTKPFQSIRRLIDRVGSLVSGPPAEKERPTAELPKAPEPEEELMDTHELEVTTADTLPLEQALREHEQMVEQPVAATESLPREETMKTETRDDSRGGSSSDSDVLLDIGDYEPVSASADDDFVLDLDDEPGDVAAPAYAAAPMRTFVEPEVKEAVAAASAYEPAYSPQVHSSFADTQEVPFISAMPDVAVVEPEPEPVAEPEPVKESVAPAVTTSGQLTPEMIDVIARRVVEMMSDKVVREIAWEVVPDLAELLIKEQLEKQAK
ncbi:MAG TPA: response regulator [Pyrinomonadaceae bacterium]|nr:response regulator [Pyrinomonadaceae bacterium]